jgi:NTP pyrophosphatase (non-canonical NTP hydrolase)
MTKLDTLAKELNSTAMEKGFWNDFDADKPFIFYAKQIAMIHSEATEIMEAIRKDKGEDEILEEIADLVIRTLDLFEGLKVTGEISKDLSLDRAIIEKSMKNKKRPHKHGVRG